MAQMQLSTHHLGGNSGSFMKKIKFSKPFLFGLYLFIRQRALSVDRSLNYCDNLDGSWTKLVEFFSNKVSITSVLEKVRTLSPINLNIATVTKDKYPKISRSFILSFFGKNQFLTEEELIFIYSKLYCLRIMMLKSDNLDRYELSKLRVELSHAEALIRERLNESGNDCIEHFSQNEILKCKSLEELLGYTWP